MIEIPFSLIKKLWHKLRRTGPRPCTHCRAMNPHEKAWKICCKHAPYPDAPNYKIWICCECGRKRPDIF